MGTPGHRRMGQRRGAATRTLLSLSLLVVVACGSDGSGSSERSEPDPTTAPAPVIVSDRFRPSGFIDADEPAALALSPDGDLLIGERRTGRILAVAAGQLQASSPAATEFARVDVATEGQQGLLGLVVLADGTVLAGMTRPDDDDPRQVVVSIAPEGEVPGGVQPIWIGPPAAPEAIGGRLALTADGRVLIGLGDFLRGKASSFDPDEPYSKLLSLDPAGPPDQEPVVVSEGWNNPFAFTVAPDGAVWIADNAPGEVSERIGRGDGRGPLTEMDVERAPSGLAVLGPDELAVCGVVSGLLELVPVADGEAKQPTDVLAEPCELGVLALPGGGLAVAEYGGVTILTAG